jgi:hypothetical protein
MLSGFEAVFWAASVTFAVKLEVPVVVGVPVMAPLALRPSPEGKVPFARDQAYGGVPPLAVKVAE